MLDRIEAAITAVSDAWLLDRTSDPDHARSVFTVAGTTPAIKLAMEAVTGEAILGIDLRRHAGEHPRIGAIDVVPFVPLGATTMPMCVELAREFAATIASRHGLPVFLYGEAALRPERRILANIRRPQFEGLTTSMSQPGGDPDFGPARPHPSAGACAVGARQFLIAFNIQLATEDVAIARRIAARIRERDGGLPGIQALGLRLGSERRAQVSMNVLDYRATPLWMVWETVGQLAQEMGTEVVDSELVGLTPNEALLDVSDHIGISGDAAVGVGLDAAGAWLQIRRFDRSMTVESRLASMRATAATRSRRGDR